MSKAQIDQMEKVYQVYRSAAEPIIKRVESSGKPPTKTDENAMANHTNIFESQLMQILNANQRKRLRELSIQAGGTAMLLHPEISKQLKLTPQQISRLETGIRNAVSRIQKVEENAARQAGLTNEAEVRKLSEKELKARVDRAAGIAKPQVEKIRTETRRQLLAILTQSQRQQWINMQGKPFID
jgi:transcriptional regulator with XRE-family HTH domain